ncbi:MAG: hypothetical protein IKD43_01910 [Clostridia bacterium]|nr:hypothetical protein [Clostridia bacterium]
MWKLLLVIGIFMSVCTLSACEVSKMSSLEELSKPYTGVYECERLMLGAEDRKGDFEYLRLELGYGGTFTLSYETSQGVKDELSGTYRLDAAREEITMSAGNGIAELSRTYRMQDGSILIDGNFLGKNLFAEFKM